MAAARTIEQRNVMFISGRQGYGRHAGADQRRDRHPPLQQGLLDRDDLLSLGKARADQIDIAALIDIAGPEGSLGCRRNLARARQLAADAIELIRQKVDLGDHGAYLSYRFRQSGGIFVVQLLPGCCFDSDIALVLIEDRQLQRDLRPEVADIGVVAAAGDADRQVGKARQDCGAQLRVLRAVAQLQRYQIGSVLRQRRQFPLHRLRVPRRKIRHRIERQHHQLKEVGEVVTRTFAVGLAATIILAMAGGVAMSLSVLRRVENVSRASRAIMAGDLGRRMALRGTDDEFDHLSGSPNAMLDRIESLMLGLEQVSNDIAHDLRMPLTRLRQRLELAQRRETTVGGFRTALDDAIANADEILETFGALLRIAQIEAGTRRAGFGPVRLDTLLTELVDAYQPVAEEKDQILTGRLEPALNLLGDRELLTLLFANLIENAIRHCPARSLIEVKAERAATGITAWIADNGPGIPAAYREKVLQRFYRLEASRTTPGNGLGLSVVRAIATLHHAGLVLEDNKPGLRCVLHFRLED